MTGELVAVPVDLADWLTQWPVGVKVSPFPPDGVGEPAVWVELDGGAQPQARRTVRWAVVVVAPAGWRQALLEVADLVWDAVAVWGPPDGVAVDRNAIDLVAGTELVAGDSLPGVRFTIPVTYRPC